MADKTQALSNMTTRQKVTAGVVVIIVIILIWQVFGLFGGGSKSSSTPSAEPSNAMSMKEATHRTPTAGNMQPQQITPQPAQLTTQPTLSADQQAALIKMQEETQTKYLAALSELQMLKVARDIAETNQAIMAAKLAAVASEKKIVDMLVPPGPPVTPEAYAKNLVNPMNAGAQQQQVAQPQEVSYSVISVSELQYRWSAVLGYKGSLYNVHVGDILPPDGSKVVGIDKSGVVLEKTGGVKAKVSLVPII